MGKRNEILARVQNIDKSGELLKPTKLSRRLKRFIKSIEIGVKSGKRKFERDWRRFRAVS